MPGISYRIISFAKLYNQMKFLVTVVSSFVKWAPVQYKNPRRPKIRMLKTMILQKYLLESNLSTLSPWF
jgi:hypothetical protein